MKIIIPMAGKGSRFFKEGYKLPKYMIDVKGKTLLEYSLESLPLDLADEIIIICLEEHKVFNVRKFIKEKVHHDNVRLIFIKGVTRGQAETVYLSREFIKEDDEILIYNIDTYFSSKSLRGILENKSEKCDGIIGSFIDKSSNEQWSFAEVGKGGYVTKTAEKEKISSYALTGLYHFTVASDFFNIAESWINSKQMVKGEFYIAPMYNDLIKQGKEFQLDIVSEFIPLGTPEEVQEFELQN